MSKLRVDEVQSRPVTTSTDQTIATQRRRELHNRSQFEKSGPATFAGIGRQDLSAIKQGSASQAGEPALVTATMELPSGRSVSYPAMNSAWEGELQGMRSQLSAEDQAVLTRHAESLATAVLDATPEEAAKAQEELPKGVASALSDGVQFASQAAAINAYPASQMVTGETLTYFEQQIRDVITNISAREEFGTEAKATAMDLQDMVDNWPDDGSTQLFTYSEMTVDGQGNYSIDEHKNVSLTKEEAESLLTKLQQQAESAGSMTTMESFQLEQLTQKYRQASEVLSAIVDLTHKELSALIGNVRA